MHGDSLQLSELQYRLWARMIVTGVYLKKDTPPQVPMITGVAPKRNCKSTDLSDERKTLQDSIVSTATAVVKAMSSANQSSTMTLEQSPHIHQSVLGSSLPVSPGKATDIRGKSFSQQAALRKLYEVLTQQEFEQQKNAILSGLKKTVILQGANIIIRTNHNYLSMLHNLIELC